MTTDIKKLTTVLTQLKIGTTPDEVIEQSDRFVFKDGKIFTFNDNILVIAKSPAPEIEGAVIAQELLDVLNKYAKKTAIISEEEDMLVLSYKGKGTRVKAGVDLNKEISLPLKDTKSLKKLKWKELPPNFGEALKAILPCTSPDSSMGMLRCVHVYENYMESTDNYNLARWFFPPGFFFKKEINIFRKSADLMKNFKFSKYARSKNWMFFKMKNLTIVGVRNFSQEDTFPEIGEFFEKLNGEVVEFPAQLKQAVNNTDIFLNSDNDEENTVTLSIKKGWLAMEARGASGFIEEKIKVAKDLPEFKLDIINTQLQYILGKTSTIEFGEKTARIESDNVIYISALR